MNFKLLNICLMVYLSTTEEVKSRINAELDKLYHIENNVATPYVCLVCDRFTGPNWTVMRAETLEKNQHYFKIDDNTPKLDEVLEKSYKYEGYGKKPWMNSCLLSKRGVNIRKNRNSTFVLCKDCDKCMRSKNRPTKAIANGFAFGSPPKELTELRECELAMVTTVKSFGYCYTFTGGRNCKLKGTLGYFKVRQESVVIAATVALKLAELLQTDAVFILYGELTDEQKEQAKKRFEVRPQKVMDAIRWLVKHNDIWKHVDLAGIEEAVENNRPMILDYSESAPEFSPEMSPAKRTELLAKECDESFSVYFPDGTMTNVYGGKQSAKEFQKAVFTAQSKGYDSTVICNLNKEFTNDYTENNFVQSCLLQCPFGRGGPNEERKTENDDDLKIDLTVYAEHLSMLSEPCFHTPMFVLKLFNMKLRAGILRSACQKLNGDSSIWDLRNQLSMLDFSTAIENKYGDSTSYTGDHVSQQLLRCLESVQKTLPHTDAAARRARQWMDACQHNFGLGGVFLTVTPDDENSFLVTAYIGIDNCAVPCDIENMTAETLKANAKIRKEIRINYPGITALNFEYVLDIVIREVIGWDVKNGKATDKPGLFGICKAFGGAVEEQGRTSLHVHFIIWIEGFQEYLTTVSSSHGIEKKEAERHIAEVVDNSISTNLFTFASRMDRERANVFDHSCQQSTRKRKRPTVCDVQQLRNLRHKDGHKNNPIFATCPDCDKNWTCEDLVLDYMRRHDKLTKIDNFPDTNKILDALCYEYTKPGFNSSDVNPTVVHANKDHHLSCHATSCFKTSVKKNKSTTPLGNECRMRKPDEERSKTSLEPVLIGINNKVKFYSWTGKETEREFFQVLPKRNEYDLFMNTYVPAIGESRIGGNSNARIVTPGPIGMYTIKYPTKNTQHENEKPYDPVLESLTVALNNTRRHEDNRAESLRLIIRGAFAANKTNIIGSSQAAFLTRRKSRFVWSHEFAYIPLQDLVTLMTKGSLQSMYVKSHNGKAYADIQALHYLCRPSCLSELCPKDFFEEYEVVSSEVKNRKEELMDFEDTHHYKHPSSALSGAGVTVKMQSVRSRHSKKLAWVGQWNFQDVAFFGCDVLNCSEITEEMESYSFTVLALCHNYSCIEDLKLDGSSVLKLRQLYRNGRLKKHEQFLQNIQDSAYNFGRIRPVSDTLQAKTQPFVSPNTRKEEEVTEEEEELPFLQGAELDMFLDKFEMDLGSSSAVSETYDQNYLPKTLNLNKIRQKGAYQCGTDKLCKITTRKSKEENNGNFVTTTLSEAMTPIWTAETTLDPTIKPTKPKRDTIVSVLVNKIGFGSPQKISHNNDLVIFPEASGTALSITNWARYAILDKDQRRAFEVFASSFVLTFFRDAELAAPEGLRNQTYLKEKLRLYKLAGRIPSNGCHRRLSSLQYKNLVCFLHGPGGSGKSAVLELLLNYAREYCQHVGEIFTETTIVVTACSGVAATLVKGRTVHSAVHLMKEIEGIKRVEKELWEHTRLLIVDEISFASKNDIIKINERVKHLKDNQLTYGGIDIIFCGDLRQLEPFGLGQIPLHHETFSEFHGAVNCYLELKGTHRFAEDPEWGMLLMRFRDGVLTEKDVDVINTRVVKDNNIIPSDVTYATYRNIDRTSINNGLFQNYCRDRILKGEDLDTDCILVLSSEIEVKKGNGTFERRSNQWEEHFWQNCGEGDCQPQGFSGRFDPGLLLYYKRPMMVNNNLDVSSGIAKGTKAYMEKIHLKPGKTIQYTNIGSKNNTFRIPVVRACDISRVAMRHESSDVICPVFMLEPKRKQTFRAKVPYPEEMQAGGQTSAQILTIRGTQLPILCNNATTGHKLQGATIKTLFVHSWSNVRNWTYVVLSRVKTLKGLFLRRKLEKKDLPTLNHIPVTQEKLVRDMRDQRMQTPFSKEEYKNIFGEQVDSLTPLTEEESC